MTNNEPIEYTNFDENIEVGNVVSLCPEDNFVRLSHNRHYKRKDQSVIGVCIKKRNNTILVANKGIVEVIVKDIICLGDKLTTSDTPGVACAIKYENLEERQFNTKSIGKVIGVHNVYNKATVLLDIH